MGIEVHKGRGLTKEQALADATSKGLWVTLQESDDTVADTVHWHTWDTHLYLIEGEYREIDPENESLVMEAGDYIVVPARTLHAGRATKKSVFVIGLTSELFEGQTIRRDPDEL